MVTTGAFIAAFVAKTHIALSTVAAPAIIVIPRTLKLMRKQEFLIIRAGFDCEISLPTGASVGPLLVFFGAGNTINRRKGSAVGTAHDVLQVAVAYLRHGAFLPTRF